MKTVRPYDTLAGMFSLPQKDLHLIQLDIEAGNEELLAPEERLLGETITSPATKKRFISGRCAAHQAIASLGGKCDSPIVRGANGAPIWPAGIVGSISHSHELAVSVVARSTLYRSIGVDLEYIGREFNEKISERVLLPSELAWVAAVPDKFKERLLVIFSAKEGLYKALSQLGAPVFWFHDVTLRHDIEESNYIRFESSVAPTILENCNVSTSPDVEVHIADNYILSLCLV